MNRKFVSILSFMILGMSCNKSSEAQTGFSPFEQKTPALHIVKDSDTQTVELFKDEDEELTFHILTTMDVVRAPLSAAVRLTTAHFLVGVANKVFDNLNHKKQWITLLSIESSFNHQAVSHVGAVGIGQLMPQFAKNFAAICKMKRLKKINVKDKHVNATLSACLFRYLLNNVENESVNLALVAYNAGLKSQTLRDLRELKNINKETSNYIAKFSYVNEMTQRAVKLKEENAKISKEFLTRGE